MEYQSYVVIACGRWFLLSLRQVLVGYPHHVAQFFALVASGNLPAAKGGNKNPVNNKSMVAVAGPSGVRVRVSGQERRWPVQPLSTNGEIRRVFLSPVVAFTPPENLLTIPRIIWGVVR